MWPLSTVIIVQTRAFFFLLNFAAQGPLIPPPPPHTVRVTFGHNVLNTFGGILDLDLKDRIRKKYPDDAA